MISLISAVSLIFEWIPFFRHRNTPIEILHHRRRVFENYLLSLDAIIRRLLALRTNQHNKDTQDWLDPQTHVSVTADIDGALLASIISSCSPSLLAYLREWQQAAHVLACIDIATVYISRVTAEDRNPLIDRICETMMATILLFPLPEVDQPAQPRPDDVDRIRDRRVFTDEPQMHALILSLDNTSRADLENVVEQARTRLPLLPASFRDWESENKGIYAPKHVDIAVN